MGVPISGQVTVKLEPVDIEEDAWVFEKVTGQKAKGGLDTASVAVWPYVGVERVQRKNTQEATDEEPQTLTNQETG